MKTLAATIVLLPTVLCFSAYAQQTPDSPPVRSAREKSVVSRAPEGPEAWQRRLASIAFLAASKVPLDPHIKTRSRLQEQVANLLFDLKAPRHALSYGRSIENWRRGLVFARYAFEQRKAGREKEVERALKEAEEIVRQMLEEQEQAWRRDRVRQMIARTHLLGGDPRRAAEASDGLVASETSGIAVQAALAEPSEAFSDRLAQLDRQLKAQDFEVVTTALRICVALHERDHADPERRALLEERVTRRYKGLNLQITLELCTELADQAIRHGDLKKAASLAARVRSDLASARWLPEDEIRHLARLARLLHDAGQKEEARKTLQEALALYGNARNRIVNIYRADALVPLALARQAMGDLTGARETFGLALEEAVVNPNSVPRCTDLVEICCAMASGGVEPDEALWSRIEQTERKLGPPW